MPMNWLKVSSITLSYIKTKIKSLVTTVFLFMDFLNETFIIVTIFL